VEINNKVSTLLVLHNTGEACHRNSTAVLWQTHTF